MESNSFINAYDDATTEKLPACTIRRHSKMGLDRGDMLQLLSYLEGELQARDVVIATLMSEGMKRKLSKDHHTSDPYQALQRDASIMHDYSFGEAEVRQMYDEQLRSLEYLISTQQRNEKKMKDMLMAVQKRTRETNKECDEEQKKHEQSSHIDASILQLLQSDQEKLKMELEEEKKRSKDLHAELEKLQKEKEKEEEGVDYELLAVQLIQDQNVLATKLNKLQRCDQQLDEEICRVQDEVSRVKMAVQQEEDRLMQEEAVQEKYLSDLDFQRQQLQAKLDKALKQQQLLLQPHIADVKHVSTHVMHLTSKTPSDATTNNTLNNNQGYPQQYPKPHQVLGPIQQRQQSPFQHKQQSVTSKGQITSQALNKVSTRPQQPPNKPQLNNKQQIQQPTKTSQHFKQFPFPPTSKPPPPPSSTKPTLISLAKQPASKQQPPTSKPSTATTKTTTTKVSSSPTTSGKKVLRAPPPTPPTKPQLNNNDKTSEAK